MDVTKLQKIFMSYLVDTNSSTVFEQSGFFQNKGYLMRAFKKFAYHTIFQGKVKRKEKERP